MSGILLSYKDSSFNFLKLTLFKISILFEILFHPKFNFSNISKFTFFNTLISDNLFPDKSNFFNPLKLAFSKISIFDYLFPSIFNISNFSQLISDIFICWHFFKDNNFKSFK